MSNDDEPDAMLQAIITLAFIGIILFLGAIILAP